MIMQQYDQIFQEEIKDLNQDIDNVNTRLDIINKNIILLQTNIDRLTKIIMTTTGDKSSFYRIQTDALKTLSLLNSNYQQLLELKFKYRSQKGEFSLKSVRFMEIELKKISESEDISHKELLTVLSKLSSVVQNQDHEESNNKSFKMTFDKDEII